jgi:hypothetical protein
MRVRFVERLAGWLGSAVGMSIAMPLYIWSFHVWIKFMVQGNWINISWLKDALQ